jgi:hypothetical protein
MAYGKMKIFIFASDKAYTLTTEDQEPASCIYKNLTCIKIRIP